ncbi:MAG: hypothetical protein HS117_13400 [Verrucomicrobiaceae bacterium]|nr:hypothetical protein [Verrucomicrobiaceae bacterium]
MNTRQIHQWRASAAINSDASELALQFTDGTQGVFKNLPPMRLAALVAVLESSQRAFVTLDGNKQPWISNAPNAPGE